VTFPVRRLAIIAVVAMVLGIGIGYVRQQSSAADRRNDEVSFELLEPLAPAICQMQTQLQANNKAGAFNTFWQDVHIGMHYLVSKLSDVDRGASADLQVAKAHVEKDLGTLAPSLEESTRQLEAALRPALIAIGAPEPQPCQ
jgi:hypothetical protein